MIDFNSETRTFNLILDKSYYAFQIDGEGCLVHLGWGPRPAGAADTAQLRGRLRGDVSGGSDGFERQTRPDELITFGDVSYHEVSLKVNFPVAPERLMAGETAHVPVRDVRLRYQGHNIVADAQPGLAAQHGQPAAITTPRDTLQVHLQDPAYPFRVTLCYRLTPEHDIIERWCILENQAGFPVNVEICSWGTLHLPRGTAELTAVSGYWAREFTTRRELLPIGTRTLEGRAINTGAQANPFFLLNRPGQAWEESGTVYFGALAYSGNWRIALEQLPTLDLRVHAGYNPFDFDLTLGPQERHVTPALVCGVSERGWGGASRRLHAFARERVLPRPPRESVHRPVLYNSWEATYFDLSYEGQVELARKAAAMGVELFCVDDGWFGARRSDWAGLGDWTVAPELFPEGLGPLIAEVQRLGMMFGLWVEPEMINPDSDLYRAHPEWVLHFPGRPRSEARHQLVLDFGRDEVVDYIFQVLDRLVEEYPIEFFKWDMNRAASEPGSPAGKAIWQRHVAGLYGLMDRLRARHPRLDIQSCSGGGSRIDLGVLARTDQFWTSDNTDAMDRIRIQEGCSLAYPARAMEAWVTDVPNHQTGRITPLALRFDVAMRGALGIGANLNRLSQAELDDCASYIRFYKRIRHVIQDGELYRLQRLEEYDASIIEYVLPDAREAVYSVAVRDHQIGRVRPPALLQHLDPAATYSVINRQQREILRVSGYELMTLGIPGDAGAPAGFSRTLYLQQV